MRVQLKWSSSRQMWVGQAVDKTSATSSWVRQVMRWISPVEPVVIKRHQPVARVWQSARQRSF
jgi:hypothetical protein